MSLPGVRGDARDDLVQVNYHSPFPPMSSSVNPKVHHLA